MAINDIITREDYKILFTSGLRNIKQPEETILLMTYFNPDGVKVLSKKFRSLVSFPAKNRNSANGDNKKNQPHAEFQAVQFLAKNQVYKGDVVFILSHNPCKFCTRQILQYCQEKTEIHLKLMFSSVLRVPGGEVKQTFQDDLQMLMLRHNIEVDTIGEWHWAKLALWDSVYQWWKTKPATRDGYLKGLVNKQVWQNLVAVNDWEAGMKLVFHQSGMLKGESSTVSYLTRWTTTRDESSNRMTSKPVYSRLPITRNLVLNERVLMDSDNAQILSDIRRNSGIPDNVEEIDEDFAVTVALDVAIETGRTDKSLNETADDQIPQTSRPKTAKLRENALSEDGDSNENVEVDEAEEELEVPAETSKDDTKVENLTANEDKSQNDKARDGKENEQDKRDEKTQQESKIKEDENQVDDSKSKEQQKEETETEAETEDNETGEKETEVNDKQENKPDDSKEKKDDKADIATEEQKTEEKPQKEETETETEEAETEEAETEEDETEETETETEQEESETEEEDEDEETETDEEETESESEPTPAKTSQQKNAPSTVKKPGK